MPVTDASVSELVGRKPNIGYEMHATAASPRQDNDDPDLGDLKEGSVVYNRRNCKVRCIGDPFSLVTSQ
jgi:hypothetical protein